MHRTDVSASHSVPSHPVCPGRFIIEKSTRQRLDPSTVTDADPVPKVLPTRIKLTELRSVEYASVLLADRSPAVITTRRVPRAPCPVLHRTDVSDSHSVPSHPVSPDNNIAVYHTSPRLDPCTDTETDPVPAPFPRCTTLTKPRSTDHPSLMLTSRSPADNTIRRVPRDQCPTRHRTDVSDSHSVPLHLVCPDRSIAVKATSPRLDPCTLTEADPVPALFPRRITLTDPASTDHPSLMLPYLSPADNTIRLVPREPCPALHRTDVSDSHSVPSHLVCPDRTIGVKATAPKPAPCTVNEAVPVPALLYPDAEQFPEYPPLSDFEALPEPPPLPLAVQLSGNDRITLTLPMSIEYTAVTLHNR
jgi:hypothetical protein